MFLFYLSDLEGPNTKCSHIILSNERSLSHTFPLCLTSCISVSSRRKTLRMKLILVEQSFLTWGPRSGSRGPRRSTVLHGFVPLKTTFTRIFGTHQWCIF